MNEFLHEGLCVDVKRHRQLYDSLGANLLNTGQDMIALQFLIISFKTSKH